MFTSGHCVKSKQTHPICCDDIGVCIWCCERYPDGAVVRENQVREAREIVRDARRAFGPSAGGSVLDLLWLALWASEAKGVGERTRKVECSWSMSQKISTPGAISYRENPITAPDGALERTMSDTTNTDSTWPTGIPEVDAGRLISDCFRDEPANEGEYVMDVRYAVSDRSYSMAYPSEDAALAALEALTKRMGGTLTSSHHGDFTAPGCNTSDAHVHGPVGSEVDRPLPSAPRHRIA